MEGASGQTVSTEQFNQIASHLPTFPTTLRIKTVLHTQHTVQNSTDTELDYRIDRGEIIHMQTRAHPSYHGTASDTARRRSAENNNGKRVPND